jgi:hypothetical protein
VAKSDGNNLELELNKGGGRRMENLIQREDETVGRGEKIESPIGERKRYPEIIRDSRKVENPARFKIKSQHLPNQRGLVKRQKKIVEKRKVNGG